LNETSGAPTRLEMPANAASTARLGELYLNLNPRRQLLPDLDRVSGDKADEWRETLENVNLKRMPLRARRGIDLELMGGYPP